MSKTSISLPLFTLLSLLSLSYSQEFTYLGFSGGGNGTNIVANGIAAVENDSGILRLTNLTSRLIGHAFYPTPLRFKDSNGSAFSFSTAFAFAIAPMTSTLGGHGFAFVITPDKKLTGAQPSQYLGIFNASDNSNFTDHVFAVEFDTVQDFEFFDINDNHVGIDINNLHSNRSATAAYYSDDGTRKTEVSLISGDTLQAWVDYDNEQKVVNVSVSPFSSKPKVPLMSFSVDLSPFLLDEMYVGFSASTGLIASSHYLMGWSFKMNGVAQSLDLSSLPSLPKVKKTNTTLVVAVSLSAFIVLMAAIAAAAYLLYKIKNADIIEPWELEYGPHRFSYNELKHATKNFRDRDHLLGFGGFGKVYRGVLPGTKAEVAVKRVSHGSRQGLREFVAEIASIGRLRHRNLVRLQGWCRRRGDLMLVYDYMHNGSLDKYLFEETDQVLSWDERYRIIKGVASALLYLHEEWESVVIHRDVKASNVLLDIDMNGRLGDFGLAKLYEHGANPSTTRVVGTLGYLAPEMTRTGKATASSDVFGFGALVLETISGRRPIEPKASPEELVLVDLVWEKWSSGKWGEVVDPKLEGGYDIEEAEVGIKLGLLCSHPSAAMRPTMREVVRYLDGRDALEVPEVNLPPGEESVGTIGGSRGGAGKDGEGLVGSEVFVHSYPTSSSFDKVGPAEEVVVSFDFSPLSRVSV